MQHAGRCCCCELGISIALQYSSRLEASCALLTGASPNPPPLTLCILYVQAVKAAKTAEAEVSKLNYRILHLVRSLRGADQQLAASSSS